MNKSESLFDADASLAAAGNEMCRLGFGDPIAISAETGLGMHDLYLSLKPLLEDYMLRILNVNGNWTQPPILILNCNIVFCFAASLLYINVIKIVFFGAIEKPFTCSRSQLLVIHEKKVMQVCNINFTAI